MKRRPGMFRSCREAAGFFAAILVSVAMWSATVYLAILAIWGKP